MPPRGLVSSVRAGRKMSCVEDNDERDGLAGEKEVISLFSLLHAPPRGEAPGPCVVPLHEWRWFLIRPERQCPGSKVRITQPILQGQC